MVLNRHGSTWRGWRLRGMHMHGRRCDGGWGEGRPSSDDVDRCGRCSTRRRRRRISVPLPRCRCPGSRSSLTLVPSSLGSTLKEVKAEDGEPHFRLSLSLTKTATFLMDKLFGAAAATPPTERTVKRFRPRSSKLSTSPSTRQSLLPLSLSQCLSLLIDTEHECEGGRAF